MNTLDMHVVAVDALVRRLPTWDLAQAISLGASRERFGPSSKVFAVDVQQEMLDRTAETIRKHQLSNVELVLGDEASPRLPGGALDLVFIAHAYHEFSSPEAIIRAVNQSLKQGGRLVVVEFAEGHPFVPLNKAARMTEVQIRAEIEPARFDLDRVTRQRAHRALPGLHQAGG